MQHCQVTELTVGGVMNEGFESMKLGLGGMPAAAEDIMVARDIRLAEITGGRLHIQHISTERAVELVREGKKRGVDVTAEACPHHFTLTDERLRTFDSNYKMNPPLRTRADVDAVIGGLRDGNHRPPRHRPRPARGREEAPRARPGAVRDRRPRDPDPDHRARPDRAGVPDLARGHQEADGRARQAPQHPQGDAQAGGADADVTIIDPDSPWKVDPSAFHSKSRNTPYGGWDVRARAHTVIVAGEVRYTLGGIVREAGTPVVD